MRRERRARGLSQERLAQLAGCSTSMVRLLEAGYEPRSSGVLDRIAHVLETSEAPADDRGLAENADAAAHTQGT